MIIILKTTKRLTGRINKTKTPNITVRIFVEKSGELSNYFERDLLAVIAYIAPAGL